jgi:hypothetical protein
MLFRKHTHHKEDQMSLHHGGSCFEMGVEWGTLPLGASSSDESSPGEERVSVVGHAVATLIAAEPAALLPPASISM